MDASELTQAEIDELKYQLSFIYVQWLVKVLPWKKFHDINGQRLHTPHEVIIAILDGRYQPTPAHR